MVRLIELGVKKKKPPTIEQLWQANISAGKPANSGIKWNLIESEELVVLHGEKKSMKELAIQLERTEVAIMAQLEKLSPSKVADLGKVILNSTSYTLKDSN